MNKKDISALLPPNATTWEKNLAVMLALFTLTDIPLRRLWNPDTCPVALLPWLAWTFSVDRWDEDWGEAQKRQAIKDSWYIHSLKGTLAAVERAVSQYGATATVIEWFEENAPPGTFRMEIGIPDTGLSDRVISAIKRMVNISKPVSRHVREMRFIEESTVTAWCGAEFLCASIITIDADV
ncbi:phage tail protein I [Serratia bockelmannii]|uniref:phage tail protein I n=1 Tax=Serratia bockelmannii TaxID=2703793 RepID=UPI003FA71526